ncbi:unnamed protein product [Choristocarpus tenellus]
MAGSSKTSYSRRSTSTKKSNRRVLPSPSAVLLTYILGVLLVVIGVGEIVTGSIVFADWESYGAFWVGILAVVAGLTSFAVTRHEPAGGVGTVLFLVFTILTIIASVVSLIFADGQAYIWVQRTDGNCYDASDCSEDFFRRESSCAKKDCVCWEEDSIDTCWNWGYGKEDRWCVDFEDDCDRILVREKRLMGVCVCVCVRERERERERDGLVNRVSQCFA